ncbi:MAG: hypothetical protein KGR26_04710 [Cyanobacteria bacterium REEB65]|nr:hypothetical protein [Cyanobacteria bacterium REEB65]
MKNLMASMITVGTLLTGCGTATGMAGLPPQGQSPLQAAATQQRTSTVITSMASQIDVPSPMPGHLLPVAVTATITGADAAGDFAIVIRTSNPGGERFVPDVVSATRNGQAIPHSQWHAVGSALSAAALNFQGTDIDALSAITALQTS